MTDKIFNDDTLAQIVQVQAIEISQLQSKLDAIKKAWGATMDKASDDVFDNLDKLIGGEE